MNKKEKNKIYNEANKEYRNNYMKEKYKILTVRFRKDDKEDQKIYRYVRKKPSMSQYVKDLISADMKK